MLQGDPDKNNLVGFDFTGNMIQLMEDIVKTHPVFSHIRLKNILISISHSNGNRYGVVAKIRPMRFEGGSYTRKLHGTEYTNPEININGNSILYILYFYLPRFLNYGELENKLSTVVHELHHISPLFNGDIRRFTGKNYAHGNSRISYDALINAYAKEYISLTSYPELSAFLKYNYSELRRRYGAIYGDIIRIPRLKPANYNNVAKISIKRCLS